jgi:mRNA-degrading endonuclease RelE of RelBE toxin-antitoxin system
VASYDIAFSRAAERSLRRTPGKVAHAVIELIYGALAENPQRLGKPLQLDLAGLHSARRGDFRVVYRIDEPSMRVVIVAIEHRADVYRPR